MDSKKSKEGVRTPVILSKSKEQNFLKNCEKSMTNSIVWDLEKNPGNEKGTHFCCEN